MANMAKGKLTPKQEMFVDAFLHHLNGAKAYIEAYTTTNPKTGEKKVPGYRGSISNAYQLLRKDKIKEAIKKRRKELQATSLICNVEELMEGWSDEIRFDIADLVDDNGDLKDPNELPLKIRRLVQGYKVTELSTGTGDDKVITIKREYKLPDRQKARIELGKRLGFYPDETIQVTGKDGKDLIPEEAAEYGRIERAVRVAHLVTLALERKKKKEEEENGVTGA